MKYLVDSDWVVDYLAGKQEAISLLSSVLQDGIGINLIALGEIYEGIYYGRDPQRSEAVFRQFLRSVEIVPLNRSIMQRFGQIRGDLRRRGQLIGDPDILIAATAHYYDHSSFAQPKTFSAYPTLKSTVSHAIEVKQKGQFLWYTSCRVFRLHYRFPEKEIHHGHCCQNQSGRGTRQHGWRRSHF